MKKELKEYFKFYKGFYIDTQIFMNKKSYLYVSKLSYVEHIIKFICRSREINKQRKALWGK